MPVLLKENFNRWYSLRSYYMAITISDIPFQVNNWSQLNLVVFPHFNHSPFLHSSGDFLRDLRGDRLLLYITADGVVPVRHVSGLLSADLVRGPECGIGRWRCDERAKRRFPGPSHVRPIPALLRLLCQLRCDTDLLEVDYVFVIHQIWVWGNCPGHLWVWKGEAEVLPDLLPFQVADDYVGGAGHVGRWLYAGHCSSARYFRGLEDGGLPLPSLEDSNCKISKGVAFQRRNHHSKTPFRTLTLSTSRSYLIWYNSYNFLPFLQINFCNMNVLLNRGGILPFFPFWIT